jgi:hypothetical protein
VLCIDELVSTPDEPVPDPRRRTSANVRGRRDRQGLEGVGFAMDRRMLLGIKDRAERHPSV